MPGIFGPESDSEEDVRQINYANYSVGDFISFKKMNQSSLSYGVISEILDDTSQGKSYDIIYYDTGRTDDSVTSNPVTRSILRENISLFLQDPLIQLNYHTGDPRTGVFRTVFQVKKIPDTEVSEEFSEEVPEKVPEEIREQLLAALNTDNGLNTPSASRSTTGTSYGDISRSSSSSISRSSSSGGKRYRKRKNKTRRCNKKQNAVEIENQKDVKIYYNKQ
jgi:predicted secreted protein